MGREDPQKKRDRETARYHANPDGRKQYQREYRQANLHATRAAVRLCKRRRSGAINATGETRDGPCEICSRHAAPLHWDHDHATGLFRGWLCSECNTGLGKFQDNLKNLANAICYLRKTETMSQTALQAILTGKKPSQQLQPASPSTSAPVATPVATPAVAASPQLTPAPAPAAARSDLISQQEQRASAAAASAAVVSAAPSPAAASTAVAPGPNAAAVATPQGSPQDTLATLLGAFQANAGKMPQVNPPEAPKVLAGATAAEVAGHPEPEPVKEVAPAPVAKPAEVLAAEQEKKQRRTAAVVQAELDVALQELAAARAALASVQVPVQTDSGAATESEALAEAVELIQQLQAEAKVCEEDKAKAWARVAEVEAERDLALAQNAANRELFEKKLAAQPQAPIAAADSFGLKGPRFEPDVTAVEVLNCLTSVAEFLPKGSELRLLGRA
jgi:hypothetical protein